MCNASIMLPSENPYIAHVDGATYNANIIRPGLSLTQSQLCPLNVFLWHSLIFLNSLLVEQDVYETTRSRGSVTATIMVTRYEAQHSATVSKLQVQGRDNRISLRSNAL